ncbi:MAG TPA: response regulator, partial [Candidatus Binatia bacterium]|nr:response regulator [Candidatus Binatia bacterium]
MNVIETINHEHGPRIIVLQNSQVFSEILTRCIKDWFRNPDVVSFENGDDAWAELMRLEPDLLMTDRIHAGMNGEELVWRLAAKEVRYPVLLLSADMPANDELPRSIKLV